jgi:hypothetical protein
MNLYLKIFLGMGIPFGICIFLLYGLVIGAWGGMFFGGFMSLTLGSLHHCSVQQMSSGRSQEATGVHHVRHVTMLLPYDAAFDLCFDSLGLIKECKPQKVDRSQGKITARAGITWRTWGDVVSFEVREVGGEGIQVKVSSRPVVRMTLVDYGKNLENVEKIVGFLNSHSRIA